MPCRHIVEPPRNIKFVFARVDRASKKRCCSKPLANRFKLLAEQLGYAGKDKDILDSQNGPSQVAFADQLRTGWRISHPEPRAVNSRPKVPAQHRLEFRMPHNLEAKRVGDAFNSHIIVGRTDAARCKHVFELSGTLADRSSNDICIVWNNHNSPERYS